MLYAQRRSCAGFVLDVAVRDTAVFVDADFPFYARSLSHRGPYKNGRGQLSVAVSIDGNVVHPGDVIVGDEDGIVTFAQSAAQSLIDAARKTAAVEDGIRSEIANGKLEQVWLDKALKPFRL